LHITVCPTQEAILRSKKSRAMQQQSETCEECAGRHDTVESREPLVPTKAMADRQLFPPGSRMKEEAGRGQQSGSRTTAVYDVGSDIGYEAGVHRQRTSGRRRTRDSPITYTNGVPSFTTDAQQRVAVCDRVLDRVMCKTVSKLANNNTWVKQREINSASTVAMAENFGSQNGPADLLSFEGLTSR